jgi:hypothetical protein
MKKIPEKKIYPTRFNGYYVGDDGTVWTHWNNFGCRGELRKLSQYFRGGTNPNDRYLCVNISIKNEFGKTIKQIKYYTHRLIAETLISNPNNHLEINHIDRNKSNNNILNLEWTTRKENMSHRSNTQKNKNTIENSNIFEYTPIIDERDIPKNWIEFLNTKKYDDYGSKKTKKYKIIDLNENIEYDIESIWKWTKENWNYLSTQRTKNKSMRSFYRHLLEIRGKNKTCRGFKVI